MKRGRERRRVVVTGLGVVAPNGVGVPAFRSALRGGRSGIRFREELHRLNFGCQIGGVPDIPESDRSGLPPTIRDRGDSAVYASIAALECARSAGLGESRAGRSDWRSGAVVGAMWPFNGSFLYERERAAIKAREPTSSLGKGALDKVWGNGISTCVGELLGLGGQITTNSSACATGSEAVVEGYVQIALGLADVMFVGGVEAPDPVAWAQPDAMRDVLCSNYNELPEKGSQPLGAGACGFVPGAGAGILCLEDVETALDRGASILAELVCGFSNSGGQRNGGSWTFPNPEGVVRCIRRVVEDSGLEPRRISLINGHLTSTRADVLEVGSWLKALDLRPHELPLIQATKSMIGHCIGAAGAIEAVAVVDQIVNGYVHPSINSERLHPDLGNIASSVPHELVEKELDCVIKGGFGFGDVNACLLFRRWGGAENGHAR